MEYGIHKEEIKEGFIGESKTLDIEKINAETEEVITGVETVPVEEIVAVEDTPEEIIEG